ncbi:MAG: bifunctional diguanylate cyclase/phosphodiesterase [Burkholderiaceae bacterium]|nr:MAG: bifunctional diguanylate cyclase/phosphodiesterase [Burkholderiaceae bacterium]
MMSMLLASLALGIAAVLFYVHAETVKRARTMLDRPPMYSHLLVPFPLAIGVWGWLFVLTLAHSFPQPYGVHPGLLIAVLGLAVLGLVGFFHVTCTPGLSLAVRACFLAGFAAALTAAEVLMVLAMRWEPAPRWNAPMLLAGYATLCLGGLGLYWFCQPGVLNQWVDRLPRLSLPARTSAKMLAKGLVGALLAVVLSTGLWLVLSAAQVESLAHSLAQPVIQPEWLAGFVSMVTAGLLLVLLGTGLAGDRTGVHVHQLAQALSANVDALQMAREVDPVTCQLNRLSVEKHLQHAVTRAAARRSCFAVFYIGLDAFRLINESLGFHSGDNILLLAASRIQQMTRSHDVVARAGGDEFIVVAESCDTQEGAGSICEKLLEVLSRTYGLPGQDVNLSASIGVAFYPQDGSSVEALLANANLAMTNVKRSGRNQFRFYSSDMMPSGRSDFLIQAELRDALNSDQIEMFFQPQYDLHDMVLMGCEALVRWRLPDGKLRMPDQFIGVAERTGLILPLGRQVMELSCAAARRWHQLIGHWIQVGVNVSAIQFQQADFVDTVAAVVESSGIWPRALVLEVTESTAMNNAESTLHKFEQLDAMGVNVSIDDFGTGYSSLAYLKRFNFHHIKIDRAFVNDLNDNRADQLIVKAVIDLARNFGVQAVAEGVENQDQHLLLCGLGCSLGQGYLYGRPVPENEFVERFLLAAGPVAALSSQSA